MLKAYPASPLLYKVSSGKHGRWDVACVANSLRASRYHPLPPAFRKMRETAGLTQRELAKALRLSHTMVHNSEFAESRVDGMEFADWCKARGVDPVMATAGSRAFH